MSLQMAAALSNAQELAVGKALPTGTVPFPEALWSFEILQQWKIPRSLSPKRKERKKKKKKASFGQTEAFLLHFRLSLIFDFPILPQTT